MAKMYNKKVHNVLSELDQVFSQICSETDTLLVHDILQWAEELEERMKGEETKHSSTLLLPKTPSEKKAYNRRGKNTLHSQSVLNVTDVNKTVCLDETITTRTRGTHKGRTTKRSRLCNDKNKLEVSSAACIKEEGIELGENEEKCFQETTFVVPQTTSTRTKPVVKKKQGEIIPVPKISEDKLNRTLSGTPMGLKNKRKMSRTLSGSPIISSSEENSTQRISRRQTSKILDSGIETRTSKKRPSEALSPVDNVSNNTRSRSSSGSLKENKNKKLKNTSPSPPHSLSRVSSAQQWNGNELTRTLSQSPVKRSSSVKSKRTESSEKTLLKISPIHNAGGEETPKNFTTYVLSPKEEAEENLDLTISPKLTPASQKGGFSKMSKTSTPVQVSSKDEEKTPIVSLAVSPDMIGDETETNSLNIHDTYPIQAQNSTSGESEDNPVPEKKRKLKKNEESFKENIEESVDTVRITRTKSKALKKMIEESEAKQTDLAVFAKKLLDRAKMTSLKKSQLATLLENNISTPKAGPGGVMSTKSKYHLLLSNSKQLKTPLATLSNSAIKIAKPSGDKSKPKNGKQKCSDENLAKSSKKETHEKEDKLKSKQEKEKEAALKRQEALKRKQEELKRKNELKQQQAMKQREKLVKEKYNLIQSEKEKEEKHKIILQERQMKLKEEALKKKMLTQQKIAETNERRRLEEEARIAKLKEIEAEEQRLALEKQKEQERQEKRAQERLALQKAREEYELQMKQVLEAEKLKAEKQMSTKKYIASASKMQSACKRQRFDLPGGKKEWDYKPRNENDYGLDDEHSEVDSEDERNEDKKPPVTWASKIINRKSGTIKVMTLEMMNEYMPCYQKTPDVTKMFKMTPSKRIKRTSSAIWNTPSSL